MTLRKDQALKLVEMCVAELEEAMQEAKEAGALPEAQETVRRSMRQHTEPSGKPSKHGH